GAELPVLTATPAALPCNSLSTEVICAASLSLNFTEETAPVRSRFLTEPYPITTNSSFVDTDGFNFTRIVERSPTFISVDLNPIKEITNVELGSASIKKSPFASDFTPLSVPFTITVAP